MPKKSAGILLYRIQNNIPEVLLVHPGGPFWHQKDTGAWSIPKGEPNPGEELFDAAKREMQEETGISIGVTGVALKPVKQKSGKIIYAWAIKGDADPSEIKSNSFEMEWPPHSGNLQQFPEIDRASWFTLDEAKKKIVPGHLPFIDELAHNIMHSNDGDQL